MASVTWFGQTITKMGSPGAFDFAADTIKVSIHTGSLPNIDTADFWDDVSGSEHGSTGDYTTGGGNALTGKSVTYDSGTNVTKFDAADLSLANTTFASVTFAVVYKDTGTDGTSPLLWLVDFGGAESTSAETFEIRWHADGIAKATVI